MHVLFDGPLKIYRTIKIPNGSFRELYHAICYLSEKLKCVFSSTEFY